MGLCFVFEEVLEPLLGQGEPVVPEERRSNQASYEAVDQRIRLAHILAKNLDGPAPSKTGGGTGPRNQIAGWQGKPRGEEPAVGMR